MLLLEHTLPPESVRSSREEAAMSLSAAEKKVYYGLVRESAARVLGKLDLRSEEIERARGRKGRIDEALERVIKKIATTIYPLEDEVFELTLDDDPSRNDPMAMARRYGYGNQCRFTGRVVKGRQTRWFRLERVYEAETFSDVLSQLGEVDGRIPAGQWIEAFRESFPQSDGKTYIVVADPSWVFPSFGPCFPGIRHDGRQWFRSIEPSFDHGWGWLMEVKPPNVAQHPDGCCCGPCTAYRAADA